MNKNQRYAALGLTAGIVGGTAIGAVLGVPALTSAAGQPSAVVTQQDDTTTTDPATTDPATTDPAATDQDTESDATGADVHEDPSARLRESLQALVDDGTITGVQADAVAEHLTANRPDGPGRFGRRHGGHPGFDGDVVAGLLGIDVEVLREALRSGQTIAEIAEANGVDPQTVIDALVDEAAEHLELAVENGRLTADEAAERLADITERITERVNEGAPVRD